MDFNIQVSKNKSTHVRILSSATRRNQNIQSNRRSVWAIHSKRLVLRAPVK